MPMHIENLCTFAFSISNKMEPSNKRPTSPSLRAALVIVCLFLSVAQTLFAQRVFKTRDFKQGDYEVLYFHWDSVKKARILGGLDYDFAFLLSPGIEGTDYGYAYRHKTRKLVLRSCERPFPLHVLHNPDGSPMKDKNGCLYIGPIGKVKMRQFTLRLPDSIGIALSEMYRLASLTARMDTTVSDEPPITDAAHWRFFPVRNHPLFYGCYICYCSDDTCNVQRFFNIHRIVEEAVTEHNLQLIVREMPTIRAVIADWRNLAGLPSEPIPFAEKISTVRFSGNPVPVEALTIKERRDAFEIVCDISYGKWKTRCTIPAWLVDEAKTIDIWIVPDKHNRTPLVNLKRCYHIKWHSIKVGECIQCPKGVTGTIDINFTVDEEPK